MAGLDVNAKLTLDTSNFDANAQKSAGNITATGRAAAKAAKDAAEAQVLASKLAGEAVTNEARKAIAAFGAQREAGKDYAAVQRAIQRGNLDGEAGVNALAASYQKLAASRAAASQAANAVKSASIKALADDSGIGGLPALETERGQALVAARALWQKELAGQDRAAEALAVEQRARGLSLLRADIEARSAVEAQRGATQVAARALWQKELLAQDRAAESQAQAERSRELGDLRADIEARTSIEKQRGEAQIEARRLWQQELLAQDRAAETQAEAERARELAALRASIEARYATKNAGHGVSSRMAASAAVRGLENGNVGIRAVENFITTIPGVGVALQNIFPLIGAAAFLGIIGQTVEKFVEAKREAAELAEKIKASYDALHLSAATANDELAVTNDRLEIQIAKLEGKHANTLKLELDEIIVSADKAAASLGSAAEKSKQLLEQSKQSALTNLVGALQGEQGVASVAGSVNSYRQQIANLGYEEANATRSGDQAAIQKARQARVEKQNAYERYLAGELSKRSGTVEDKDAFLGYSTGQKSYEEVYGDQTRVKNLLYGEQAANRDQSTSAQEITKNKQLEARKQVLESGKSTTAEENKAAEARLRGLEAYVAQWKTLAPVTAKALFNFWEEQKTAFTVGSRQFDAILEKQASMAQEGASKVTAVFDRLREENKRKLKEAAEDATKIALAQQKVPEVFAKLNARTSLEAADAAREMNAQNQKNALKLQEVSLQEASGHSMTRIAAATALAAAHAKDYGAELDRLIAKRDAYAADSRLTNGPEDQQRKIDELNRQIAQTQAHRTVQQLMDNNSINPMGTSALVGATDALQEFTRQATDAGEVLKTSFNSALSRTNDSIVAELTQRNLRGTHNFGNAGADIFRSATGSLLKGAEGSALKALGLGGNKAPKGTQADPMWVRNADGSFGGSANSTIAGALNLPGSGLLSSVIPGGGGASGKGGISSILSGLLGSIGGFADGGSPRPNSLAWVGEEGPELRYFGSNPGTIIPNHKVGAYADGGGSGGDMHIHIDASGSHDPAATEAAVRRGIAAAAPHIIAASVKVNREQQKRTPLTARS